MTYCLLDRMALELILSREQRDLAISVWLTAIDIVKIGLLSSIPETVLVIELGMVTGIESYEGSGVFKLTSKLHFMPITEVDRFGGI